MPIKRRLNKIKRCSKTMILLTKYLLIINLLLECQYDSLNGVASLHPDLSHQTYLNMVISQKVQDSYETIDGFLKELHDREGVVL